MEEGGYAIISSERNIFAWSFVSSLLKMQSEMGKDFRGFYVQTGHQADARNIGLGFAKQAGLDYLVFIDSDVTFPLWGIRQLVITAKDNDADVVAGLYFINIPDFYPAAGMMINGKHEYIKDWSKIREVDVCGMGFTLIRKSMFDCTFKFSEGIGEDYNFCFEVKRKGGKIMLDPSVKCGHLRTYELNEELIHKLKNEGDKKQPS